jgi:hypothetical protein
VRSLLPAPVAGAAAERLSRVRFPVPMRAVPAITLYNPAVANAQLRDETASADCSAAATADISQKGFQATCTGNAATVVEATSASIGRPMRNYKEWTMRLIYTDATRTTVRVEQKMVRSCLRKPVRKSWTG